MTVPKEEAPANYVPAAAVKRRGRALSGITGRKGCVGGRFRRGARCDGVAGAVYDGDGHTVPGGGRGRGAHDFVHFGGCELLGVEGGREEKDRG